jgi:peptide/nickel transport system substrate-binding protein
MLSKGWNRREFLRLSGAIATGAMVAACAPVAVAPPQGAPEDGPTPEPQLGGSVVTAIGTDPVGLDPCNPWHLGTGAWGIVQLLYDPWFVRDRELRLTPYLMKSWTREDPQTVVFEIQEGVKFHGSGREMTAEDVVWNIERTMQEDLACALLTPMQQHLESAQVRDRYTFEVRLKTPNLLITRIPLPLAIDPEFVESYADGPILRQAEAGTGPWLLDDWVAETHITLKRNPDYWGEPPLLETFRFQIIPEERATVAAMRTGQLNFVPISRIENYEQLQGERGIHTWSGPGLSFIRLNVNHHREVMQDENVRQALRFGINRQQLVDTLSQGLGEVSGPLSPASSFYALPTDELEELQAYDPERAKSLLRQSGYDEADNRLRLVLLSISGFKNFTDVAQIVQANLREIGIDAEIRIQEVGVWVDQRLHIQDYDLSVNDHGSGGYDPDFTYYRSDQAEQEWTGGGDPELDRLIDASNVEEDEEQRREIIYDIQRLLIEDVRELYLYAPPVFEAASARLIGYTPWPGATNLRVFDWEQVYMG